MNLIPQSEKNTLKKGFKARFAIVANNLLSISFVFGCAMLLPAYFLAESHINAISLNSSVKEENQDDIKNTLQIPDEINSKLAFMESYVQNPPTLGYISSIVSYLPDKVKINSISLDRKTKKGITVVVSGVAANRDSLVSFGNSLKSSKDFDSVDVPVSSFTKDKDLPFLMTIFIANELGS